MNPNDEPALIAGCVGALLVLLTAFGVPITDAQKVAVIGFVGPAYALVAAFWIRNRVSPVPKLPPVNITPH